MNNSTMVQTKPLTMRSNPDLQNLLDSILNPTMGMGSVISQASRIDAPRDAYRFQSSEEVSITFLAGVLKETRDAAMESHRLKISCALIAYRIEKSEKYKSYGYKTLESYLVDLESRTGMPRAEFTSFLSIGKILNEFPVMLDGIPYSRILCLEKIRMIPAVWDQIRNHKDHYTNFVNFSHSEYKAWFDTLVGRRIEHKPKPEVREDETERFLPVQPRESEVLALMTIKFKRQGTLRIVLNHPESKADLKLFPRMWMHYQREFQEDYESAINFMPKFFSQMNLHQLEANLRENYAKLMSNEILLCAWIYILVENKDFRELVMRSTSPRMQPREYLMHVLGYKSENSINNRVKAGQAFLEYEAELKLHNFDSSLGWLKLKLLAGRVKQLGDLDGALIELSRADTSLRDYDQKGFIERPIKWPLQYSRVLFEKLVGEFDELLAEGKYPVVIPIPKKASERFRLDTLLAKVKEQDELRDLNQEVTESPFLVWGWPKGIAVVN